MENSIYNEAAFYCRTGTLHELVNSYSRENAQLFWTYVRQIDAYGE